MYHIEIDDCNGKLTNACGLGGLFKAHSIEVFVLFSINCKKFLKYNTFNTVCLELILPKVNCL